MIYWTAKIGVANLWVEDGFELTTERLKSMIQGELPYSVACETSVEIVESPEQSVIRKIQGYEDETQ